MSIEEIIIDPELEGFLPDDKSFESLEAEIVADGQIHEPLVAWQHHGILIDGHRRLRVYRAHADSLPEPEIVEKHIPGELREVKEWMILHQLSRRNITPQQASWLRGTLYEERKKDREQNIVSGATATENAKTTEDSPNRQNGGSGKSTAALVAEETGVSPRTVERDSAYVQALKAIAAVNAKFADDVRTGLLRVPKKDIESIGKLHPCSMGPAILNIRQGRKWHENGKAEAKPPATEPETPAMLDALNRPVPTQLREVFEAREKFKAILNQIKKAKADAKVLADTPGGARIQFSPLVTDFDNARRHVRFAMPHTTCPYCKMRKKECDACKGTGWVTESIYDNAPRETK